MNYLKLPKWYIKYQASNRLTNEKNMNKSCTYYHKNDILLHTTLGLFGQYCLDKYDACRHQDITPTSVTNTTSKCIFCDIAPDINNELDLKVWIWILYFQYDTDRFQGPKSQNISMG